MNPFNNLLFSLSPQITFFPSEKSAALLQQLWPLVQQFAAKVREELQTSDSTHNVYVSSGWVNVIFDTFIALSPSSVQLDASAEGASEGRELLSNSVDLSPEKRVLVGELVRVLSEKGAEPTESFLHDNLQCFGAEGDMSASDKTSQARFISSLVKQLHYYLRDWPTVTLCQDYVAKAPSQREGLNVFMNDDQLFDNPDPFGVSGNQQRHALAFNRAFSSWLLFLAMVIDFKTFGYYPTELIRYLDCLSYVKDSGNVFTKGSQADRLFERVQTFTLEHLWTKERIARFKQCVALPVVLPFSFPAVLIEPSALKEAIRGLARLCIEQRQSKAAEFMHFTSLFSRAYERVNNVLASERLDAKQHQRLGLWFLYALANDEHSVPAAVKKYFEGDDVAAVVMARYRELQTLAWQPEFSLVEKVLVCLYMSVFSEQQYQHVRSLPEKPAADWEKDMLACLRQDKLVKAYARFTTPPPSTDKVCSMMHASCFRSEHDVITKYMRVTGVLGMQAVLKSLLPMMEHYTNTTKGYFDAILPVAITDDESDMPPLKAQSPPPSGQTTFFTTTTASSTADSMAGPSGSGSGQDASSCGPGNLSHGND